ncbi:hypothetical protein ABW21_db0200336 [Orbilia brochopaga]|nr:hypothetical protein ABW21_db0200336 [Drechslerella brochopaga]
MLCLAGVWECWARDDPVGSSEGLHPADDLALSLVRKDVRLEVPVAGQHATVKVWSGGRVRRCDMDTTATVAVGWEVDGAHILLLRKVGMVAYMDGCKDQD